MTWAGVPVGAAVRMCIVFQQEERHVVVAVAVAAGVPTHGCHQRVQRLVAVGRETATGLGIQRRRGIRPLRATGVIIIYDPATRAIRTDTKQVAAALAGGLTGLAEPWAGRRPGQGRWGVSVAFPRTVRVAVQSDLANVVTGVKGVGMVRCLVAVARPATRLVIESGAA